ncbi:MAG: hypothetical protein ABSA97_03845 [Verrucomicrobiia bacterium]
MKDGSPESPSGIPRIEWNFDNVPDSELVACCWWEYARESEFIRMGMQRWRAEPTPQVRAQNRRFFERLFRDPYMFLAECIDTSCVPEALSKGDPRTASFPNPWQTLSQPERTTKRGQSAFYHEAG